MVDEEVVTRKLRAIERSLHDLRDEQAIVRTAYLEDERTQLVVERLFNNLINACADLAAHVRAAAGLPDPGSAAGDMLALGGAGILPDELVDRMVDMTGFRNALTHDYEEIRQPEVYRQLQDLEHFEQFALVIAEHCEESLG